ncbi:MAG TPA: hypothetical protein DCX07_06890 [Phycisphaerales bacterium]|nr:hypothetical protein [Phycisphaerales bacterium]
MKTHRLRSVSISAAVCGLLLLSAGPLRADNLIVNPGFERGEGGSIEDWNANPRNWKSGAKASIDKAEHHSGDKSLLLEMPQPLKSGERGFVLVTQDVPVEAGKSYNLRYWYKAQGLVKEDRAHKERGYANLAVWIFWLDKDHKSVGSPPHSWMSNIQTDAKDWVKVENTRHAQPGDGTPFRAPEGAVMAQIKLQMAVTAPDAAPKVWLDDVEFEEVGK